LLIKITAETSGRAGKPFAIKKLVAGAGFEPAVPQTRDYEPNRDRPISL